LYRKSSRINYFIAAAIVLLALLGGFLGSVASNEIPDGLKPYLPWAWPLLLLVAVAIVVFTIWQTKKQVDTEFPTPAFNSQNRQRMLSRVYNFWIKGVFEQSLHGTDLIALGLNEEQDALANPWHFVIPQSDDSVSSLPPGTRITEVFDDADGELLILGEPGSGKTTLLLELTGNLIERAKKDETYPIPVVFNLSSWSVKHQPLSDWLVEELNTKYQVPVNIGKSWVNTDQIMPLLDGLDEVAEDHREASIDAINDYHKQHLTPLAVCGRSSEYMAQSKRLLLSKAVKIQNLTEKQIDAYLWSVGGQLEALRIALHDDPDLLELAETPLMLSVLVLAYQGKSVEDLLAVGTAEARRKQTFEIYTQRMLHRRGLGKGYTPQQTIHYLNWLAKQMTQHNQTVFYIERIQPDWLPNLRSRRIYHGFTTGLIFGVVFGFYYGYGDGLIEGLVVFLIFGLLFGLVNGVVIALSNVQKDGLALAIFSGIFGGLEIGLTYWLLGKVEIAIQPVEIVTWSWKNIQRNFVNFLLIGSIIGLVLGMLSGLSHGQVYGPIVGAAYGFNNGLLVFLVLGLFFGLSSGLSNKILEESSIVKPNQGIWRSAVSGLFTGLLVGLLAGLFYILIGFLILGPELGLYFMLNYGLGYGGGYALVFILVFGLWNGGKAFIQHFILRWFLWHAKSIPWNYPRSLDYAADCILLRKVGGGYIFIHRLLLEYFASLNTVVKQPASYNGELNTPLP
jgi:eukaryotic-like serine/threonine-protein kinase